MDILTVNTGSSSVRMAAFRTAADREAELLSSAHYEEGGGKAGKLIERFLSGVESIEVGAAAHRVVHGGKRLSGPCLINEEVEAEIERLSPLAPLHNPVALRWIRACRSALGPHVPQVAVFDTGFFSSMPPVASTYALPGHILKTHEVRRYGFHGLAHKAMWERWTELKPDRRGKGRLITIQLGAGCSMTAIKDGKPLDTSMGFSPLEGLVMATRAGDVDPGLITYLAQESGLTPRELHYMLNNRSGLLGLSGRSGDMKELLEKDGRGPRLAVELYCYRVRKYIGAYLAVLRGADAVVFSGGVGENSPRVRETVLRDMGWSGLVLDSTANSATIGNEGRISSPESTLEAWVVPGDEAMVLLREAAALLL